MSEKDTTPLSDDDEPETYRTYAAAGGWKDEGIRSRELLTIRRTLTLKEGQAFSLQYRDNDQSYLAVFLNFNEEGMAVRCKDGGVMKLRHGSYLINGEWSSVNAAPSLL